MVFHFRTAPKKHGRIALADNYILFLICLFVVSLSTVTVQAQALIRGTVLDEHTHQPLTFVAISVSGENTGTVTDSNGYYEIRTAHTDGTLQFSSAGYQTQRALFTTSCTIDVVLRENTQQLGEVIIRDKKKKYRNKDNPAVALIREVIGHKEENQLQGNDFASYQSYEKMTIALENPGPEIQDNPIVKKYRFVFNNQDTVSVPGKKLFPIFIEENISDHYYRRQPENRKTIIKANKRINMDKRFVNNESLGIIFKYLYQDIDIYDNNIYILTSSFLSPISNVSPTFYRFFITDTLIEAGQQIVRLSFVPRNTHDLLFYGRLYIVLNGHYSIQRAELNLSKHANINWINSLHADLDFAPDSLGSYYLVKSRLAVDFGLGITNRGVYGDRTIINSNWNTRNPLPDRIFQGQDIEKDQDSLQRSPAFWESRRPEPLSPAQAQTYKNMDSLNSMRSFNRLVNWSSFIFSGYKRLGPIEIGPWGTFYSFNPVEGFKLRVGGRTTTAFSSRYYLAGNVAYGFKDQRWKYFISGSYSLNNKSIYGYPKHYLQASLSSDTRIPGRGLQFQEESNILGSIKRGINDKYLYNDVLMFSYVNELIPHLRFQVDYENWQQQAAGGIRFMQEKDTQIDTLDVLTTSSIGLRVRWAPHEKFLVRKEGLMGIPCPYPIITAGVKAGIQGLQGGRFDYQWYQLQIEKRFYLSALGYADVVAGGGYLSGQLPYPLLFIPRANQTYNFQQSSYNLMNFLEFVSDHYAELKIDYHMRGFLFNKIPLFRSLRLQEVASFKALYGGLRDENHPASNPSLLFFPTDATGRTTTFPLGEAPYMELSVGIENIFRILRVDFVRRLNYLNHPDVSPWGIRGAVVIAF
jgi:hypothetical protein